LVLGELAIGSIPKRKTTLADLLLLRRIPEVDFETLLQFVELHHLFSSGLSWVDVHLLASCLASDAELITDDRQLASFWKKISAE
jgi:hypothetical protein